MDRPSPDLGWPRPEGGGIVLGWLARVTVILAIMGVTAFDGLSVLASEMGARDAATAAARAASRAYEESRDARGLYAAANEVLAERDAALAPGSLRLAGDGTVTLRVTRVAPTLLLHRFSPTSDWTVVSADGRGRVDP